MEIGPGAERQGLRQVGPSALAQALPDDGHDGNDFTFDEAAHAGSRPE